MSICILRRVKSYSLSIVRILEQLRLARRSLDILSSTPTCKYWLPTLVRILALQVYVYLYLYDAVKSYSLSIVRMLEQLRY